MINQNFARLLAVAVAVVVLLSGAGAFALSADFESDEYLSRVWQTEDGLPQNIVQSIAQTKDGYLWMATANGLARFNGAQFATFNRKNTKEFQSPNFMTLLAEENGALWMGIEHGGLVRLQDGKFTHYLLGDGAFTEHVRAIVKRRDGGFWLGTAVGVIGFKNGNITTNYMFGPGFVNNSIKSMVLDKEDNLWIATGGGLVRWKEGNFKRFTVADGLSDNNLRVVLLDRDGVLWIGGAAGLTQYKDGQFKVYTTKDGLSDNGVRSIYQDRAGHLWIGTLNGLNRLAGDKFETVKGAELRDSIYAIYEDREGNLWIGTNDGLKRLKLSRFKSFTTEQGLPYHSITSVIEDRENNLWIGSAGGGLIKFADGKFTIFTKRDGLSSDSILALHQDHAGTLWIGTDGLGVNRITDGKIIPYAVDLPNPTIRAICEDRQGRLWVGTYAGLQPYNSLAFDLVGSTNKGEHYIIRAICSAQNGDLWIGTSDGLDRLSANAKKLTTFTTTNGLSQNFITTLYEDQEGILWIGHDAGGLSRWENGKFTLIKAKDGLANETVFSILEDANNDFWMSSPQGIFRVSKKQLNDFAGGRVTSVRCDSFDRNDGMIRSECTGVAQPSAWKDHNGNLWFATAKGLVMTAPNRIKRNEIAPPVHIEEILYDDQPLTLTRETKLPTGKEKLEFHYAALSFTSHAKVRYKFRLEGYEEDWVDAGNRRVAYYSNLRPGDYTFRIIACNNDGVWNETGDTRSFSVVPFFYETMWFYSACGLAVIFSAAIFFRRRVKNMKQREEQLVQHSKELQQEIVERQQAQTQTAAFAALGQKLNAAATAEEAARILVDVADELLGWDSCAFRLYSEERKEVADVLHVDTIDGRHVDFPREPWTKELTPMLLRVLKEGPQLILRDEPVVSERNDLVTFGNAAHRSASLMFVPVRDGKKAIGMLTIQSYTPRAYDREDLKTLEALAGHCGGALERIAVQEGLREAHNQLEMRVKERTAELSNVNQTLVQEIKERARAEGALLKSESQLRLIWENSLDGMRLLDEDGKFLLVNDAYCRMVGKSKDLLLGQPLSVIYDPSRAEKVLRKHREHFRAKSFEASTEKEVILWNGKKIHLELTNSMLEFPGEPARLLTTFRDITDRKRLEEQARQSQKMESIGQLAAGIAHDFNNLLTVIQGHTALLTVKEDGADAENLQSLKEISEAAERAANLTRQLLTFSRRQVMQPKALDLNETVGHVAKMLRRLLGEHIDLQMQCASHLPAIHADTGMMEQIIINIAVNARDAMPRGGQLIISTAAVEITEADLVRVTDARPGPAVCLSITDIGCGMDAVTLAKIFEPFFTTKEVGKGTGLGLSTVYGIVKQHQGWIEVESQVGKGSTFKVFFPALQTPALKVAEPAPKPKTAGGKEMILVVEDEAPLRKLTEHVLRHYGYRVVSAESGVDALKVWQEQKNEINLLLTDMMMPDGISGRELADRLMAEKPKLKVVYTSGYSEELLGKDMMGEDIHFLPKPYNPATLAKAVRDCLDNRRRDNHFSEVLN